MNDKMKRVQFLDFARGCAVIGMLISHAIYNLGTFFSVDVSFMDSAIYTAIRVFGVIVFTMVSGICTAFSRNSLKRGGIVFVVALLITGVTVLFIPSEMILFGILSFMGLAMILTALLKKALEKIPLKIALPVLALLFTVTYIFFPLQVSVPFLFPFGLLAPGFYSADYYPLIPWIFSFWFGFYLSKPIREGKFPDFFYSFRIPMVNFIGKNALFVYILQQPVLLGLMYAFFWLTK